MRISDWSSDVCSSDLGMGLSPFVRFDIALIALAGYLLLSIHAFLSARVLGALRLSYLSAGPTELRLMLIALTLIDRKSVVSGKSVSVRVYLGGRRINQKTTTKINNTTQTNNK